MSSGKALLGVLAGMAAGAALGLLFAPEKGSNTRKKIARKGEDLADSMEDLTSSLNDRLEAKFNELVNAFGGKVKTARSKSDFASEVKNESMN